MTRTIDEIQLRKYEIATTPFCHLMVQTGFVQGMPTSCRYFPGHTVIQENPKT